MDTGKLIYDVGAHKGQDTAYYLSLGHKVIAIEGDPSLVEKLQNRFQSEIGTGQCTILNIGIGPKEGDLPFYLVPKDSERNSFNRQWALRNGHEIKEITVRCRTFESVLAEHGIPYLLKVDIEGHDHLCLRALSPDRAPEFVSWETEPNSLEMILWLHQIGYRRFSLIDQLSFSPLAVPEPGSTAHLKWSAKQRARKYVRAARRLQAAVSALRPKTNWSQKVGGFALGSSGPAPMARTHGWQDIGEFVYTWTNVLKSGVLTSSWFDIHAARE